jgi:IS605 OrfB family transposase
LITIKLKYKTDEESSIKLKEYRRQYSSVFKVYFNRLQEGMASKEILHLKLNNTNLVSSAFKGSALTEARTLLKVWESKKSQDKNHLIFGGRKSFLDRIKGNISKEELKERRLQKICCVGQAEKRGNIMFSIQEDFNVLFKPSRKEHIILEVLDSQKKRYSRELKAIYIKSFLEKKYPITYHLDNEFVYLTFDETILKNDKKELDSIPNRVIALDLNPNYIGWSIVDWKSSSEFKVIKSGIYNFKSLNDKEKELKNLKLSSEHPKRKYLSNKRRTEIFEVSKNLINKALYYKCQIFSVEDLNIKTKDSGLGKNFNKLVNNQWIRTDLVSNLEKRCSIFGFKFLKVKPEYSSFIGNFLYRSLNLPDMVLASIEIGRRAFEYYNQYITKSKETRKNIVRPSLIDFRTLYLKSLEEFELQPVYKDLIELYYFFKKFKLLYRLSLDKFNLKFSSCFSIKSQLSVYNLI